MISLTKLNSYCLGSPTIAPRSLQVSTEFVTAWDQLAPSQTVGMVTRGARVILLGAPGVGKGTYARRLKHWLGVPHFSMGDAIRREIEADTPLGRQCAPILKSGMLVPDEISHEICKRILENSPVGWLLDGYPRRRSQAESLYKLTGADFDAAVNFTLRRDVLVEKIIARRVCGGCGENYNLAEIKDGDLCMPALLPQVDGVCDKCGTRLHQRCDDVRETAINRLKLHDELCEPVLDFYRERGLLREFEFTSGFKEMWPKMQVFFNEHVLQHSFPVDEESSAC